MEESISGYEGYHGKVGQLEDGTWCAYVPGHNDLSANGETKHEAVNALYDVIDTHIRWYGTEGAAYNVSATTEWHPWDRIPDPNYGD